MTDALRVTALPNLATVATLRTPSRMFSVEVALSGAGAFDEPDARPGLAHFLEHCVMNGTVGVDAEASREFFLDRGVRANAYTGYSICSYTATGLGRVFEELVSRPGGVGLGGADGDQRAEEALDQVTGPGHQAWAMQ